MAGDITKGYWNRMAAYIGWSAFKLNGSTSGSSTIVAAASGASGKISIPAHSDGAIFATTTNTQTLTNKTLSGGTLTGNIIAAISRSSADPAPATTGLVNVTGLTGIALVAGATYKFRIVLPGLADGTSGIKYALKYTTATLTSIEATGMGYTASAVAVQHTTTTTDATLLFDQAAAVIMTIIEGTMVVNAAGTVAVQAGLHTGTTAAAVYVGATARFDRIA